MKIYLIKCIPILFVWLWSTGFIGAKYGLPYIEPFFMLFVRFSIAITVFLCIVMIVGAKRVTLHQAFNQVLVGTLLHGAYLGGVFYAINEGVPAGIVAIIVGLQPILTAIVGWISLGQTLNNRQLGGLLIGFLGIMAVISDSSNVSMIGPSAHGLVACIVALIGISIGTILQKSVGNNLPLLTCSIFQYLGAAVIMTALTFTVEEQIVEHAFSLYAAIAWLVFGLSVSAVLLLMYMIQQGAVAKVSSYFYLVPPATVFQTWILFEEKIGLASMVGCALSIYGVYLVVSVSATSELTTHIVSLPKQQNNN